MSAPINVPSALTEIQRGKDSLTTVSDSYGEVMVLCALIQPALKAAFAGEGQDNIYNLSIEKLRDRLKRDENVIYQAWELSRAIADNMADIDEATASASGSLDTIYECLTDQSDEEENHEQSI